MKVPEWILTVAIPVLVIGVGELLSYWAFWWLKKVMGPPASSPPVAGATMRGVFERLVITFGLLLGFPHIITAFAALKLGTRLHDETGSTISNNYFLVGNLMSLFIAMAYAFVLKGWME